MINLSIHTSTVPKAWKKASVIPLLKKSTLDPEEMKHYRPVSNLPYMSKLLEKVVLTQLDDHMDKHSLREPCQSAYRACHSTETAVIKIINDILCDIDDRKCVLLILLDMSAAFDTVDHSIFLNRMQYDFGICGSANEWLKSYFTDHQQAVIINGATSHLTELKSGMPQGSVLGPKGYPPYSAYIFTIARKHGVNMHMYADDTQLYISFNVSQWDFAKKKMEECVREIRVWLSQNCLKLNDSKTEVLIMGQQYHLKQLGGPITITIGDSHISPVRSARNLGAVLDSELKLVEHVNSVCRSCYASLRYLGQVRPYLTEASAATLVHAFVTSKLDSLNGILTGVPGYLLKRLQLILNNAARIVTRRQKIRRDIKCYADASLVASGG
jgi:hypothetical protein